MIERRYFVNFGLRQTQFFSKRHNVRRRNMAVAILDQVQELDQQIATSRRIAKQCANLFGGTRIHRPALRMGARLSPPPKAGNVD